MANISIEEKFFSDPRVAFLAALQKESLTSIEGRLIRLFKYCYDKEEHTLSRSDIHLACLVIGAEWVSNLVESQLIEEVESDVFVIKGVQKRIESRARRKVNSSKGGLNKAKNSIWSPSKVDYDRVVNYWNDKISHHLNKPKVQVISDKRKRLMDRMFNAYPNQPETWKMILDESLYTDWIKKGYTFNFESFFEKERFNTFYESAHARNTKDVKTENELIEEIIPDMQPVIPANELWETMDD